MFARGSRYKKLTDIVTPDVEGREYLSKTLRLLPEVSGRALHAIEETDRLDHLAYKYYKQSRKWWRICDANPAFLSPREMLGKEPTTTSRFRLLSGETLSQYPWVELRRALVGVVGVETVKQVEEVTLVSEQQTVGSETVTVWVERFERAVDITHNELNIGANGLVDLLETHGFPVADPITIGRLGKQIVIPPNIVG